MNAKNQTVENDEAAFDEEVTKRLLVIFRQQLLNAAVALANSGPVKTRPSRIREASLMSGIPINQIEAEVKKGA